MAPGSRKLQPQKPIFFDSAAASLGYLVGAGKPVLRIDLIDFSERQPSDSILLKQAHFVVI